MLDKELGERAPVQQSFKTTTTCSLPAILLIKNLLLVLGKFMNAIDASPRKFIAVPSTL
jgi:hypothetical protein